MREEGELEFWIAHPDAEPTVASLHHIGGVHATAQGQYECTFCGSMIRFGDDVMAVPMDPSWNELIHVVCLLREGYAIQPYTEQTIGRHTEEHMYLRLEGATK